MTKATKKKPPAPKAERKPSVLKIDKRFFSPETAQQMLDARHGDPDKVDEFYDLLNEELTATAITAPEVQAARVIQRYEGDHLDINYEVDELRKLVGKVNSGDMKTPEAMLVTQAHALDALFSNLAVRSHSNMSAGYLEAADRYMRLALKAQAQAAKTIQILAELKNPRPVAFVKQANIAHNQQINNSPRAQETENQPSKLSEGSHELLENTRTSSIEGGINQTLETLGTLDGAAYARG